MQAFQQGLMTGAELGGRMRTNQTNRQIGGMMASGDYQGAASAAFGGGDLQTGLGIQNYQSQQAATQRTGQITGALQSGDYDGAMSFASTPEELASITEFRDNASEAERTQAKDRATQMASVLESISGLPEDQRLAAAQQAAPMFGLDPSAITPQSLTPQAIEGLRIQALGLADYLDYRQDQVNSTRPIMTPYGIMLPPGAQPQTLNGLPEGARIRPRPNQAPSASAGGAERQQRSGVSFQSTDQARSAISGLVPGVRFTSGPRSAEDNRRVGGVPNSNHLRGRAWDLVPPAGMTMAQLAQRMRSEGFRVLDEGDHVHVSW